ncbi:sensor histidine kinase [Aureispira anguillae]|uniref:Sensor histidine kinase n=1 Tax=Aureispira anguillae TaxID=2864201 RepID=A0A915YEX1_9BACT|nr:sensor histidine kinase [Aureispira anguillae]BDS11864.1 sensor histidine kinase [Aureispira anguillae]
MSPLKNPSSSQLNNKQLNLVLHLGFWLTTTALFMTITGSFYGFQIAIFRTLTNMLCLILLFYGNAYFLVNRLLEQKRYGAYLLSTLLLFISVLALRIQIHSFAPDNFYEPFIHNLYQPLIGNNLFSYVFIFVTSLGILVFSLLYQVLVNRADKERKDMKVIHQYQQAQIQFLKAQINPHFLFNTLNNIYSLAVTKSEETPDMILKLSDLLRYVIYKGAEPLVYLEDELLHIDKFIELFQMRSETELDIRLVIEGKITGIKIEPMILIPLVENCFKHCDFDTNEAAYVVMNLSVEKNCLIFKTLNSKDNYQKQKDQVGGVGLHNIQERLKINYGDNYSLKKKDHPKTFEIDLMIPFTRYK